VCLDPVINKVHADKALRHPLPAKTASLRHTSLLGERP
jgi:hypothetical protein